MESMEVGFIYVSSNYKGMWMVGKTGGLHSPFLKNSVYIYEVAIFPNGGKHRYWLELWKPSMWARSEERRNLKAFSSFIFLGSGKSLIFTFYIWTKCVYNLKVTYFQHDIWVLFTTHPLQVDTAWTSPMVGKSFHQQRLFNFRELCQRTNSMLFKF